MCLCREGIQFLTTGIGGVGYAMYASWRVALVVLALCPFISISALAVVSLNQSKSSRAAVAYSKAGSVAYSTVSGIKTVLSLNAAPTMIQHYREATQQAQYCDWCLAEARFRQWIHARVLHLSLRSVGIVWNCFVVPRNR